MKRSIGPYSLEARLGKGGMGEVYRAYDTRLRRHVAIKHVLAKEAEKANIRRRFRREARTVARLNHPAVVQIYDILESDEGDWIVMELVEGRTVRELLDGGELTLEETLRLAREVAGGLAVAHETGIVHRDLKVENVMVTDKGCRASAGRAKILDFGLAKRVQKRDPGDTTLSGAGMVVGTLRVMSPEQIMEQEVDARSDLFSFGILLYEMCTGVSPFDSDNVVTTMTKVCRHDPPSVAALEPAVPQELSDFIDRLLEKEPEKRPQTALEVVRFLDRLTGETTVLPPLEGLAEPASTKVRREDPSAPISPTTPMAVVDENAAPAPSPPQGDSGIVIKTLVASRLADRAGLVEQLGEDAAAALLERLEAARHELLREHLGLGLEDAAMQMFERAASALEFALAYHGRAAALGRENDASLALCQGLHLGEMVFDPVAADEAVRDSGDRLGAEDAPTDATTQVRDFTPLVTEAVASLAGPGQILFTHTVDELVKRSSIARRFGDREVVWKEHGFHHLPGIDEEVELFEVGFAGDAPLRAPRTARERLPATRIGWRNRALASLGALFVLVSAVLWLRGCG